MLPSDHHQYLFLMERVLYSLHPFRINRRPQGKEKSFNWPGLEVGCVFPRLRKWSFCLLMPGFGQGEAPSSPDRDPQRHPAKLAVGEWFSPLMTRSKTCQEWTKGSGVLAAWTPTCSASNLRNSEKLFRFKAPAITTFQVNGITILSKWNFQGNYSSGEDYKVIFTMASCFYFDL